MRTFRMSVVLACVGFLAASCASEAKRSKEVREAIERMNQEHEAQRLKQQDREPASAAEGSVQRADGIAARVNEDVILFSDLEEAGQDFFQRIKNEMPGAQAKAQLREARRVVLERLIEKKLLEQEAVGRGVHVSEREVDGALQRYLKRSGLSMEQFYVELAREKISLEQYKEKLRRELMVLKMLDSEVRDHIHISDLACREYYERHPEEFGKRARARIRQIVLFTRADLGRTKREKRRRMEEFREKILGGEDFAKMAREFSEGPNAARGGDAGFFQRGELLEELDEVAFSLREGEVSPVIETSIGLHLIQVLKRESGEMKPYETVKDQIRANLAQGAYVESLKKWLESLKRSAYIDIRM